MKYKHTTTGEIVETNKFNSEFYTAITSEVIPKRFVENNTDWQKVDDIDYEIINCYTDGLYFELKLPYYQAIAWNKYFKNKLKWEIFSVKRLSDGEVFTIGDEIYPYRNKKSLISKIEIMNNEIIIKVESKYPFNIKLKNSVKSKTK